MNVRHIAAGLGLLAALYVPSALAEIAIVLNSTDENVSLVDTQTYTVVGKTAVGKEPHHIMGTPNDSQVLIANAVSNSLSVLDPKTGKELQTIKNISDPYQLGFSPDGKWFVTNSLRLDRVDIYSAKDYQLVTRVPAAKMPSHMAFDNASQFVFVTLQDSNEIQAIDLKTHKAVWKMPVGNTPAGILMTPDDKYLLVACMGPGHVEVIDWRKRETVKRVPSGDATHNFQPRGDGRHLFVSNRTVQGSISIFDMQTLSVVGKIDVPGGPDDMWVRADGKELWATARFGRKVQVIDLTQNKVVRSIPVGNSPHGLFFLNHALLK